MAPGTACVHLEETGDTSEEKQQKQTAESLLITYMTQPLTQCKHFIFAE